MKMYRKFIASVAAGVLVMALSAGAAVAQVTTQLGFVLDASGSVSTANYNLMRSGLNAALEGLPTDGSIEISVTSFSSGVATVVAPTVLTAASLAGIQSAISTHVKTSGLTATGLALRNMTNLMTASANHSGANSLINLLTDGVPCCESNANQLAADGAAYAFAQGIDALSIEAIGSGVTSASALALMQSLAFPGPAQILATNQTVGIPNPLGGSWVIPVSDFNALGPVLAAKVIASIQPPPPSGVPEPATLLLMSAGLFGIGFASRRRRVS